MGTGPGGDNLGVPEPEFVLELHPKEPKRP